MKKIVIVCSLIVAAVGSYAQTQDSEATMKAWQAFMTPGDAHKMLASATGTWHQDMTMWMAPDTPPEKSTSTAENKMILNGLYQQSTHTGNFGGMPFEGISVTGYDNAKKIFVSTWIDNMGSGMMYMEGTWDDANKTINMKGKQTDPLTGKSIDIRETLKIVDDKNHVMEMFETREGKERKIMEIKMTKK